MIRRTTDTSKGGQQDLGSLLYIKSSGRRLFTGTAGEQVENKSVGGNDVMNMRDIAGRHAGQTAPVDFEFCRRLKTTLQLPVVSSVPSMLLNSTNPGS